jgi:nucleotide-binding universal stress UspA family protein
MRVMKTILVPTDFSLSSRNASDIAAALAIKQNAELCFIHVIEIPTSPEAEYFLNHDLIQRMMTDAQERVQQLSVKYHQVPDIKSFVTTSSALEGIKEGILSIDADLIIMGKSNAPKGLASILHNSNTEKIIRFANCPVISIPPEAQKADWQIGAVAIDPESCDEHLLSQIADFGRELKLKLQFVWVANPVYPNKDEDLEMLKESISDHFPGQAFEFTCVTSVSPTAGVLAFCKETKADILFVSTHARKGFGRLIKGSITESIVQESKIPCFVQQLFQPEDPSH